MGKTAKIKDLELRVELLEQNLRDEKRLNTLFNLELFNCFGKEAPPVFLTRELLRLVSNLTTLATKEQLAKAKGKLL